MLAGNDAHQQVKNQWDEETLRHIGQKEVLPHRHLENWKYKLEKKSEADSHHGFCCASTQPAGVLSICSHVAESE